VRALALFSLATVLAGCGGGTNTPAVANLGATTSTSASRPIVPGGGSFQLFIQCMTRHGVSATSGPGGRGISIVTDVGQAQLDAAQTVCRRYMPGGGPPPLTPAQRAQDRQALLTFAKCIRAHGVPNFPEPTGDGVLDPGNVDTGSPRFKTAMTACRPDLRNFRGPRMMH